MDLIFWGFVIKLISSLDDVLTRIPVLSSLTKSRSGVVSFSIGTVIATTLTVIISILFSSAINGFAYSRIIVASLIFLLAIAVIFDLFKYEFKNKKEFQKENLLFISGVGLIVSFTTLLDDSIVMLPLFLGNLGSVAYAVTGITLATILNLFVVIYFASKLERIKYKKAISSISLIVLAVLVLFNVI